MVLSRILNRPQMFSHTISESPLGFPDVELLTFLAMNGINAIVGSARELAVDSPLRVGTPESSGGSGDFTCLASRSATWIGTRLGDVRSRRKS